MNVRCPVCGSAVQLAVGDTRLACTACGLAAPLSHVGTAPGTPPSATFALETDLTGTTLAGYELVERIGAGGMGTVYRARRAKPESAADVAIKVLRPALGTDRAATLARFAREAEAMRRLEHPRIVRFLAHGEDHDCAYIVTELVDGRDLAARLAAGRMTLPQIVEIVGQVCDGVAAAHAAGIVHRDLKPANILVGTDGNVKVADFGLAQLGAADVAIPTLTRTNVAMGTFHYLSPEQRKNAHAVDHRADIWALGVILYEMLTGELPLGAFAPPSSSGPEGCDRRVDAIVQRALAPDPQARYAHVTEMARDVRALVAPRRTKRFAVAAAATAALAGGSIAIASVVSSGGAPTSANRTPPSTMSSEGSSGGGSAGVIAAMPDAGIDGPVDAEAIAASLPDAALPDAAVVAAVPVKPAAVKPKPAGEGGKVKSGIEADDKVPVGKVPVGKVPVGKPVAKPVGKPVGKKPVGPAPGGKTVVKPPVK